MFCGKSHVARYGVEFDRVWGVPNPGHQNIAHSPADRLTGNTFYDDIELHMSCCYNCSEFSCPMVYFLQPVMWNTYSATDIAAIVKLVVLLSKM